MISQDAKCELEGTEIKAKRVLEELTRKKGRGILVANVLYKHLKSSDRDVCGAEENI